jgi:hypothetical protein
LDGQRTRGSGIIRYAPEGGSERIPAFFKAAISSCCQLELFGAASLIRF